MQTNLKCCLLLLAGLLPVLHAGAQGRLKFFNTCTGTSNYRLTNGDTIIIQCDSSLLVNSRNFSIYQSAYQQYRKGGSSSEILRSYESLVQQQDSMITSGQQDYASLKLQFDSLYRVSISSLDRTSRDIGIVKDSLSNVSTQLNNTNIIIGNAIQQVNQARKKSFLDKLYWGIGGLGIGVAVTALVAAVN